jgi:two-component system, sensor histidine kinase and response regulator
MDLPNKFLPTIDLRGSKILIADYDPLNIRVLGGILKREGYLLGDARSGERVLEFYPEFRPDLVLIDAQLPGLDGFETCRRLKQTYGEQCAPIVFLTEKASSDNVIAGLAAGAADYLRKPFSSMEVLARIRAQLRNRILIARQASVVEALSQANADKNKFLSLAAHDLRNPLASIYQLSKFLRDGTVGPVPPDQLDLIQTIYTTSQSMLGMVNELLDVVTIESGELKLNLEVTNLASLIEKCVYVENIEAAKKKSHIVFAPPPPASVVQIDPAKIKQVIDNLLTNAVKYSPPGSTIAVQMQFAPDGSSFGLGVKDQGPGIPENERDKLFKDFGRLSVRPTAGEKSTGLGLAICRKIVDAHGGTIIAENQPEGGCEFRVTFPNQP